MKKNLFMLLVTCVTNITALKSMEKRSNFEHLSRHQYFKMQYKEMQMDSIIKGVPWPLPQKMICQTDNLIIDPNKFQFITTNKCEIVQEAIERYRKLMFNTSRQIADFTGPSLIALHIKVSERTCGKWPYFGMNESYTLTTTGSNGTAQLVSQSVWGVLRGLETFSQLFLVSKHQIRKCDISDWPHFAHRGLLLDTSRHFLPVRSILENLDLMAQNKFNVFHWHIVDDPSFPYYSPTFPDLSAKGAYTPKYIYWPADISKVLDYARLRGIRVVAEFDSPGHTQSWGKGQSGLLTKCYDDKHHPIGEGLINPARDTTWDFLLALFKELLYVFPDKTFHLGGDEVYYETQKCWLNNPEIVRFMKLYGFSTNNTKDLENYYFKNLIYVIERARSQTKLITWQEPFDNGLQLPKDMTIQIWLGNDEKGRAKYLEAVTEAGHPALLSSCWYLDHLEFRWDYFYDCDPLAFNGTQAQKDLVLGGEACMWGEEVDSTNLIQRIWPRASAVAERLWTNPSTNHKEATERMKEFRCRMLERGYPAQPQTGPGFCPDIWLPN